MQDITLPENYKGYDFLTIKKIAENIRFQNNKIKQNSHLSNLKNESTTKEDKITKVYPTTENLEMKRNQMNMKNKRLDYQKLLSTNRSFKVKRESLLIDHEIIKINENKITPMETLSNITPSLTIPKTQNPASSTKILFGTIYSKKTEFTIKEKAIKLFKWAIKMIRAWLRYLNHIIKITNREQQKYLFSIQSFSESVEIESNDTSELKFDKSIFKATKEIELTPEMKKILTMNPKQRTEDQVCMVMYGLSALSAFNEYPVHLKKRLCTVAYFRKIDSRRVIIRQGHVAEYFYFIISGKAIVTITTNNNEKQVNTLTKGCSFGELALLHHSSRTASVVSTSPMQLLAIARNDFFYIFMHVSSEFSKYPEHVTFIKEISIFSHLDFDSLASNVEACLCHFYKNLIVISTNDIESEWVYIVKSGSCTVLKELQVPVENKLIRENTLTLHDIKSKIQCFDEYHFKPMPLDNCTGNSKSKIRDIWRSPTMIKPGDYFYLKNDSTENCVHEISNKNDKKYVSVFIKVADLVPKDIYGLSSVIFTSEDKMRADNMASVALISNRAEMVLISKKYLAQKSNEDLIKDIRQGITQYPSENVFLENYKTRIQWEKYKIKRYHSTLRKLN